MRGRVSDQKLLLIAILLLAAAGGAALFSLANSAEESAIRNGADISDSSTMSVQETGTVKPQSALSAKDARAASEGTELSSSHSYLDGKLMLTSNYGPGPHDLGLNYAEDGIIGPRELAVGSGEELFILDQNNRRIMAKNGTDQKPRHLLSYADEYDAVSLKADGDQLFLLVEGRSEMKIFTYSKSGEALGETTLGPMQGRPEQLLLGSGEIYVRTHNGIYHVARDGSATGVPGYPFRFMKGRYISTSLDQDLRPQISLVDQEGRVRRTITVTGAVSISAIATDAKNNIHVAFLRVITGKRPKPDGEYPVLANLYIVNVYDADGHLQKVRTLERQDYAETAHEATIAPDGSVFRFVSTEESIMVLKHDDDRPQPSNTAAKG